MNLSSMLRCLICTLFVCVTLGLYALPATTTHAAISFAPPQPEYEYFKTFTGSGRTEFNAFRAASNQMRRFEQAQNVSCVIDNHVVISDPFDWTRFLARIDARCSTS